MENVFARSGVKAISLFRKHIFRTQLALSIFYFCIVAIILIISSQITRTLFLSRITPRFENRIETSIENKTPRPVKPSAAEVQEDLQNIMLIVNGTFLILAGILGYFLAGLTLAPLHASYEKEQRFLNDASHELRTPLTILRTSLENIKHKGNDAIQTNTHEAIEEVDRMNNLLQNILTLSRAEQYNTKKDIFSCHDLLENVVKRMQPLAEEQTCTIVFTPNNESVSIVGDKEALERALINLVQNAISYNKPQGTVTLSFEKRKRHVDINVKDTGVGMNTEELTHLTERFYRAEKSRTRSKGGSGLGLAIVEQTIKNHKGTLQFSSTPEKGTTATVSLPIHKAS